MGRLSNSINWTFPYHSIAGLIYLGSVIFRDCRLLLHWSSTSGGIAEHRRRKQQSQMSRMQSQNPDVAICKM